MTMNDPVMSWVMSNVDAGTRAALVQAYTAAPEHQRAGLLGSWQATIEMEGGTMPVEPEAFYGDGEDGGSGLAPPPGAPVLIPGGAAGTSVAAAAAATPVVISLAWLTSRIGVMAPMVWGILRGLMQVPLRVIPWNSLPSWLQQVLMGLGIVQGTEILLDLADGDGDGSGFWPWPSWGGGVPDSPTHALHGGVAKSWKNPTTGLWGVKYADGWMGAQRKDGTFTAWKPRKPIVIFATGRGDVRDTIKAFNAASRQLRKVSAAAEKSYKVKYRDRCGKCGYVRCRCA